MELNKHWIVMVEERNSPCCEWDDTTYQTREEAQEVADELVCNEQHVHSAWPEFVEVD